MEKGRWRWRAYVTVGAIACAAYFGLPKGGFAQNVLYDAFAPSAVVAILVARRRDPNRRAWFLTAAGLSCEALGDITWTILEFGFHHQPYPSAADVFYLAGYPFLGAAAWMLTRRERKVRGSLIDPALVFLGLGLPLWILLVHPYQHEAFRSLVGWISFVYPVMDLVLVAVVARLLFARRVGDRSHWLYLFAVVTFLAADVIYGYQVLHAGYADGDLTDLGWLSSYLLFGAAGLYVGRETTERIREPVSARRFAALGVVALIPTGLLAGRAFRWFHVDLTEVTVVSAVLLVLVLARLRGLVQQVQESGEETRRREEHFRALIENSSDSITLIGPDGAIVYSSPSSGRMFGYRVEDFLGQTGWDLVHPEDIGRAVELLQQCLATPGATVQAEYRIRHRDGRWVWIEGTTRNMLHDPAVGAIVVNVRDVTEQKQARDELRRALQTEQEATERLRAVDEMKNTFLSAVSHELRNPLATILGSAYTLERKNTQLSAAQREVLLSGLTRQARKLERLLADLLDLDRLTRGILEPVRRRVDVTSLAERVVADSTVGRGRDVVVDTEGEAVGEVDVPMVERIVENLLANAVRHTPQGTQVWVKVSREPEGVVIAVEDEGPGVPHDSRETIFEPFEQGKDVPAHSPGVGIGLSLVARFAELHGGRAWVTEREGGGASFRVFLPDPSGDGGAGARGIEQGAEAAAPGPSSPSTTG